MSDYQPGNDNRPMEDLRSYALKICDDLGMVLCRAEVEGRIEYELAPRRRCKQTDCRYEPQFEADDNFTFLLSEPDLLMHSPNKICGIEPPHQAEECEWFKNPTP